MNSNEHSEEHAAEAKRITNSVHSRALEPTMNSLSRKHAELERAKSDARERAIGSYRTPGESPR
jgi:hypothetical protein